MPERGYLVPEWEGSCFQRFAKNFAYRNQWRVANVLGEYEDVLAFCALQYVQVRKNYGATVNSDKHLMYWYHLWLTSEFNTLSNKDTNSRKLQQSLSTKEDAIEPEANLSLKLMDASSELKSVMTLFFTAPQEILETLREESSSCHPKKFFTAIVELCGFEKSKATTLAKELQRLLQR